MVDIKHVEGNQIVEVTPQGLSYRDQDGQIRYIDFEQCYSNYFRDTTSPAYIERMKELNPQFRWDEEGVKQYIERRRKWKEVGARMSLIMPPGHDGPYIEFHTEPRTHFKFATKEEYSKVIGVLHRAGWKTFDRS